MPRILDAALTTCWAITPDGLAAIQALYEQAVARGGPITLEQLQEIMADNAEEFGPALHMQSLEALSTQRGQRHHDEARHAFVYPNGVGVMNLFGPIYPRANMMTASGATSISQFTQEFIRMYEDSAVKGIVINSDTPGGDVRGIGDAGQIIHALSKKRKKPVKTYAEGLMASAGYWIGSTTQELWGSEFSSMTGSIGVVMGGRAKSAGEYEIVSSQSPKKRLDPMSKESDKAVLQQRVDDLASIFVDNVALHRGITPEQVLEKYGQGDVMAGPRAKSAGLLDKLGSLSAVVEAVAKEAQDGTFRQSTRSKSSKSTMLLSFTNEEYEQMPGLADIVKRFRATDETIEGTDEETAQSTATDEESNNTSVAGSEGQNEGEDDTAGATAPPATVQTPTMSRDQLEEQFSANAELFATQMTIGSRILPAQQGYAASDLMIALIDDKLIGGKVGFLNTEGDVVTGTREEACRARYEAMPKHSLTKKAVAGIKEGHVEAKVLVGESKESKDADDAPMTEERRRELLGLTSQGQRVLAQADTK